MIEDAPELPLSVACKTGNLEMVQLLINHGAEVQGTHGTAWSPIQATVLQYREQAPELIKLILENGAETQGADGSYAPICLALQLRIPENADGKKDEFASEKITETVRILMDGSEKENARYAYFLIDSARQGNLPLVRWFLSEGWSKDTQYNGKTAYDYAIENGYADIAELVVP